MYKTRHRWNIKNGYFESIPRYRLQHWGHLFNHHSTFSPIISASTFWLIVIIAILSFLYAFPSDTKQIALLVAVAQWWTQNIQLSLAYIAPSLCQYSRCQAWKIRLPAIVVYSEENHHRDTKEIKIIVHCIWELWRLLNSLLTNYCSLNTYW